MKINITNLINEISVIDKIKHNVLNVCVKKDAITFQVTDEHYSAYYQTSMPITDNVDEFNFSCDKDLFIGLISKFINLGIDEITIDFEWQENPAKRKYANKLKMSVDDTNYELTLSQYKFIGPDLERIERIKPIEVEINSSEFCNALEYGIAAIKAGHVEERYRYVSLLVDESGIEIATTDARMLSVAKIKGKYNIKYPIQITLPLDGIVYMMKYAKIMPMVKMQFIHYAENNEYDVVLRDANRLLVVSRYTQPFPRYRRIYEDTLDYNFSLSLPKDKTTQALYLLEPIIKLQEYPCITFVVDPNNNKIKLEVQGDHKAEKYIDFENGIVSDMKISLRYDYILRYLRLASGEKIYMRLQSQEKPIYLSDSEKSDKFMIIMPVTL